MLNTFRNVLGRWLGSPSQGHTTPHPHAAQEHVSTYALNRPEHVHLHGHVSDITHIPAQFSWHNPGSIELNALDLAPQPTSQSPAYDPHLLDNARTQWQFGDWDSLVNLQRDTIEPHPERAKLALLIAAGHQQVGDMTAAQEFVQLARDWGCDKKLISRVLVAGVYNTLGKAAAIMGEQDKALGLFEQSVRIGAPGGEGRLLINARTDVQLAQLQLGNNCNWSLPSIITMDVELTPNEAATKKNDSKKDATNLTPIDFFKY